MRRAIPNCSARKVRLAQLRGARWWCFPLLELINVLATRLRQTDEAVAAATFLTVKALGARPAGPRGACWRRRRRWAPRHPPQDRTGQPRGDGRGRARKREQVLEQLEAARPGDRSSGFYCLNNITTLKRYDNDAQTIRDFLSVVILLSQ